MPIKPHLSKTLFIFLLIISPLCRAQIQFYETSFGTVESVEIYSAMGVVEVKLDGAVTFSVPCTGSIVMFDYQAGTASETYYSMLMTAQSTGMKVKLYYNLIGPSCVLGQVKVDRP